jgi:hypothetical protein
MERNQRLRVCFDLNSGHIAALRRRRYQRWLQSKNIERNMAKREQAVVCPNCKKTGSAIWEDNENPVRPGGKLGTTLKSVF